MRRLTITTFALALGSLAATALPAAAQDHDFSWSLDPLTIEATSLDVDTDSSKLTEYRDLGSGFEIPKLRLLGTSKDRSRLFELEATNVRRNDARYTLSYKVPGRYRLVVDYNKIQHRFANDAVSLLTRTGPGRYELADPIQASLQAAITAQYAANRSLITYAYLNGLLAPYLAAAQHVDLGLQRDRLHVGLDIGQLGRLAWSLAVDHENRTGNRAYGGSFGFGNVVEIPEPIDYDTTNTRLAGEWNGANAGLKFGVRHDTFVNHVDALVWDNPFRITSATDPSAYTAPGSGSINGSALGQATLSPDNESTTVFVDGRARFGGWWASGNLSYSQMTQDDRLLPYTLNGAIVGVHEDGTTFDPTNAANLPVSSADRKIDVVALNGNLGTRFGDALSLAIRVRYYDQDNRAKAVDFPGYVRYHAVWEPIGRVAVPYAYTDKDVSAELAWDATARTRLGLTLGRKSRDREFREVSQADDDTAKLTADTRLGPVDLRASYELGRRSTDRYRVEAGEASFVEPEAPTQLPALRRFDEAERDTDNWDLLGQWTVSEKVDVTFGASGAKDDYTKSTFGLANDELVTYHAEIGITPVDGQHVYLFVHRGDRDELMRSRQSGATPSTNPLDNWQIRFTEVNDTAGLGYDCELGDKWSTHLEARYAKSNGSADFFSPPGGTPDLAVGFDDYDDVRTLAGEARLDYAIAKGTKVGVRYQYEDYTFDTFLLRGLRNYVNAELLLNGNFADYTGHRFGVSMTLAF